MSAPDGFFAARGRKAAFDRQVNFDEAFGVGRHLRLAIYDCGASRIVGDFGNVDDSRKRVDDLLMIIHEGMGAGKSDDLEKSADDSPRSFWVLRRKIGR